RAANDALVGALVGKVSLLSPTGDSRYMALNARDTAVWAATALLPLALAWGGERRALRLGLAMIVPSMIFYFVVPCAQAGYLAGLVALAAVLGALGTRRRWPAYLVAAAQLGFFLLAPHSLARTFMQPTLDEILERDVRAGFLFDALHHDLPDGARVLALS